MKRVFEGIVFENRRIGDNAVGACTTEAFEEFYQCLPIGKPVHITVEELPESKPEYPCQCPKPHKGVCHMQQDIGGAGKDYCPDKPKPEEKNCGNCSIDRTKCTVHEQKYGCDSWQPKPAEPQGWEQRFDKEFEDGVWIHKELRQPMDWTTEDITDKLKAFIRAEIERAREEEKQAIQMIIKEHWKTASLYLRSCLEKVSSDICENKHRSDK